MKLPISWNDPTLLDNEPFLNGFLARDLSHGGRQDSNNSINDMKKVIIGSTGLLRVAEAWFAHAFLDPPKTRKVDPNAVPKLLDIFIEFYWLLWKKQDDDALIYLSKERSLKGCQFKLQSLVVPERASHEATTTPMSLTQTEPSARQKKILTRVSVPVERKTSKVTGHQPRKQVKRGPHPEKNNLGKHAITAHRLTHKIKDREAKRKQAQKQETNSSSQVEYTGDPTIETRKNMTFQPVSFDESLSASSHPLERLSQSSNVHSPGPTHNVIPLPRPHRAASRLDKLETLMLDANDYESTSHTHKELKRPGSSNTLSRKRHKKASNHTAPIDSSVTLEVTHPDICNLDKHMDVSGGLSNAIYSSANSLLVPNRNVVVPKTSLVQTGYAGMLAHAAEISQQIVHPAMFQTQSTGDSGGNRFSLVGKLPGATDNTSIARVAIDSLQAEPLAQFPSGMVEHEDHNRGVNHAYNMKVEPADTFQDVSRTSSIQEKLVLPTTGTRKVETANATKKPLRLTSQNLNPPLSSATGVGSASISPIVQYWLTVNREVEEPDEEEYEAIVDEEIVSTPGEASADNKPPLPRLPPIWAQSRQEVCETFPWFRSYQGGVYYVDGLAKGYLLSAFSSRRDIFQQDGKLIVSHGGGKAESIHSRKGKHETHLANDQLAQDRSVRALLKTHETRRTVVLLIDDKYTPFPYSLTANEVTYAVLGYYIITHAWAEYEPAKNDRGRVVRYKFAFQWCENQGTPWWIDKNDRRGGHGVARNLTTPANLIPGAIIRRVPSKIEDDLCPSTNTQLEVNICMKCHRCDHDSPQVYTYGWMCLNPDCPVFWKNNNEVVPPDNLVYSQDFLTLSPVRSRGPLEQLCPAPPTKQTAALDTTGCLFTRGWHCSKCGRLSCRIKWVHWECLHCGNALKVQGQVRLAKDLRTKVNLSFHHYSISDQSFIMPSGTKGLWLKTGYAECQTFKLPDERGEIIHIRGCDKINQKADEIFKEYQEQAFTGDLQLRRWPMRAHKCRGALLTNYFSHNAGEPYQYVGGTENTVPFDKAPEAVLHARELIEDRLKAALDEKVHFNEVLTAAYMERQKMAFHSDSEVGLGPIVAGLSLGAKALMHFRLQAKFDANTGAREHRRTVLTFLLNHGDILVMKGAGVQQFYEHTVVPFNFRIAATARYISHK